MVLVATPSIGVALRRAVPAYSCCSGARASGSLEPIRTAGVLALAVAILTLWRATSCAAGVELIIGVALTGVLAAAWNVNPERDVASQVAKSLILVFIVGISVFGMALLLNGSACPPRP